MNEAVEAYGLNSSLQEEVKGPSLYCSTSAPLEVKPAKLRVRMNHGCVKSNNTKSQCPDRPSHERQSCLEHSWADHSAVSVFTEMVLGSIASCENRLFLNSPRLKTRLFGLFGVLDSNGWFREQLLREIQETDVKIMLLKNDATTVQNIDDLGSGLIQCIFDYRNPLRKRLMV
ncbi:hypothetical protein FOMG_16833 [Fusarium oxysporum f. sp. melonis 26406]|uniref:Uncharacterized protein n=1 Tax=Fusarium oxysporum f. sp. melonis 26406 TaxID=1089452 RepID=W9ZDG3_FUSOX|nr:hypothetical protein FOMG_16833 [Fusarium oxysporum f. sp. melonis 26406]